MPPDSPSSLLPDLGNGEEYPAFAGMVLHQGLKKDKTYKKVYGLFDYYKKDGL